MSTLVEITPRMIAAAESYEKAVESTRTVRIRSNYTSLEAKRRYFYGYLGELCFSQLLRAAGKELTHNVDKTGKKVDRKFILHDYKTGNPIFVNVATSSSSKHANLAYPKDKLLKSFFDYLVAIRLDMPTLRAEVWGYATKREMTEHDAKDLGYGNLCYLLPLYKLTPIDELIKTVRDAVPANS